MKDGFQTTDWHFAAAMLYVFDQESLTRIEVVPDGSRRYRNVTFHIDAPSLDCAEYEKEFQAGELAISNLLAYIKTLTWLQRKVNDMQKAGELSWCSPSWIMGKSN